MYCTIAMLEYRRRKNDMLELLSPAGSMEALRAAVQNGANAVYLGYDRFNARMGAQNFSADELQEAIVYCHVPRRAGGI